MHGSLLASFTVANSVKIVVYLIPLCPSYQTTKWDEPIPPMKTHMPVIYLVVT
jgi:hypothetical protein